MIVRQVILQFDSYHSQSVQVSPTPDEDSSNSNECPWNRSTIGQCGVWDLYVELRITPLKPSGFARLLRSKCFGEGAAGIVSV